MFPNSDRVASRPVRLVLPDRHLHPAYTLRETKTEEAVLSAQAERVELVQRIFRLTARARQAKLG
jgi:hypothetical protein